MIRVVNLMIGLSSTVNLHFIWTGCPASNLHFWKKKKQNVNHMIPHPVYIFEKNCKPDGGHPIQ